MTAHPDDPGMTAHSDDPGMTAPAPVRRGLAVPCFAEDPAWLAISGSPRNRPDSTGSSSGITWSTPASMSRSGAPLDDGTLAARLPGYAEAGATWWIESVKTTEPGWQEQVAARVQAAGPASR